MMVTSLHTVALLELHLGLLYRSPGPSDLLKEMISTAREGFVHCKLPAFKRNKMCGLACAGYADVSIQPL